jgi:hypothetical protein
MSLESSCCHHQKIVEKINQAAGLYVKGEVSITWSLSPETLQGYAMVPYQYLGLKDMSKKFESV